MYISVYVVFDHHLFSCTHTHCPPTHIAPPHKLHLPTHCNPIHYTTPTPTHFISLYPPTHVVPTYIAPTPFTLHPHTLHYTPTHYITPPHITLYYPPLPHTVSTGSSQADGGSAARRCHCNHVFCEWHHGHTHHCKL